MRLQSIFIINLKKFRKLKGFSQMKLAESCDSSTSYIGQIEIGKKFPSIEMIEKIANALQIKPHLLFFDEMAEAETQPAPEVSEGAIPTYIKEELIKQLTGAVHRIVKRY
jgi:transcriptional regulator with XRE-family HTH domain